MSRLTQSRTQTAPHIAVRTRWFVPLLFTLGSLVVVTMMVNAPGFSWWFRGLAIVVFGCIGAIAARPLLDRRPWVEITDIGFQVRGETPIRWHEIVHIQVFRIPRIDCGAMAIFVTDEAAQRLTPPPADENIFLYADVPSPLQQRHVWLADNNLQYSARDIAAELEARRHGTTGPLTARLRQTK
jgi:hypothetical protein